MNTATVDVTIDDLRDALNARDSAMTLAVAMNLVAIVSASADPRLIAQTRARIDRLRTAQSVPEVDVTTLSQAVVALGLSLTRLRISAAAERSSREGGELTHEIRAALSEPARPKDLIERTGADPAQIARVLRKLEDAGEVERVASPVGDGRERWYRLRSDSAGPVDTAPEALPQNHSSQDVKRQLRDVAPVNELRKRGWISDSGGLSQQAIDVAALYRIGDLSEVPSFALAARRSKSSQSWTPAQMAWVARVRQQGEAASVATFNHDALYELASELPRRLHAGTAEIRQVAPWLADCGVALVIEPGLSGAKLDGVAVSGANGNKIIGHSVRLDRFDSFVFTLLHELAHILNGDIDSPGQIWVDSANEDTADSPKQEVAADELASKLIFPNGLAIPGKLTAQWVKATADATGVHPSLVIGHAQHARADWTTLSRHHLKVRHMFVGTW